MTSFWKFIVYFNGMNESEGTLVFNWTILKIKLIKLTMENKKVGEKF